MTGLQKWYKIPLLTKLLEIRFYVKWRNDKLYKVGFDKNHGCKMTFEQAFSRLENKRLGRKNLNYLNR